MILLFPQLYLNLRLNCFIRPIALDISTFLKHLEFHSASNRRTLNLITQA